jgi:hypothetical protein
VLTGTPNPGSRRNRSRDRQIERPPVEPILPQPIVNPAPLVAPIPPDNHNGETGQA